MLQKAGRNMEHTLIGAYVGLLLGYLIMDNKVNRLHCLFSLMMLNWSGLMWGSDWHLPAGTEDNCEMALSE